jgi:RNA polymerase sigma factor (sigma-70 family)
MKCQNRIFKAFQRWPFFLVQIGRDRTIYTRRTNARSVTGFSVTTGPLERHFQMAELPDAEIIQGLARGDTRAFDRAFAELRAPLYTFLVRLSGRVAIAEELLQETWLRLARSAAELPEHTQLRPWLFTVARNLHRSHRRWALLDVERLRQLAHLPQGATPSPFESAAANRTERALEHALARLPLDQREVLLLCSVSGFEPAQAAAMLGITPEATRQRLARARARMRESLELLERGRP